MKLHTLLIAVAALLACRLASAQQHLRAPSWDTLKFLEGTWETEAGSVGRPGQATRGTASFKLDLQDRVMLRTDHSEYPANQDHPAFAHDGLMVIYSEPGGRLRGEYWDNEGHFIRYTVTSEGATATFLGDEVPGQPRFRLTCAQTGQDAVTVTFEIAGPDTPDQFHVYVAGKTRRKK